MKKISKLLFILLILTSCKKESVGADTLTSTTKSTADSLKPKRISNDINTMSEELTEAQKDEFKSFIPKGFSLLSSSKGNLNLDALEDAIIVIKADNEKETSDVVDRPTKRPLLILIGKGKNEFELVKRNENAVYCVDCGGVFGDPFEGVTIKNGYFSVEHYGGSSWRWTRIITFKYSKAENDWFLHKDGGDSFNVTADPDTKETKIRTVKDFGKIAFEKYDIYKGE